MTGVLQAIGIVGCFVIAMTFCNAWRTGRRRNRKIEAQRPIGIPARHRLERDGDTAPRHRSGGRP